MMSESIDSTEALRREAVEAVNSNPRTRNELEVIHGRVWNTDELKKDFTVRTFLAPFVFVTKRDTGEDGTLLFQHMPRFYYGFESK